MDKENLAFPHHFPYDFASPYSTESESDDEDVSALTRRFSRSASLKEPLYIIKEKRVFSGSPESSTLGWSDFVPPPFVKSDEDAWNLIYAAAGQVARMKMIMSMSNGGAGVVPYYSSGEEFFRQQRIFRNKCVAGSEVVGGGCGGRPWPPLHLQNQRLQQKPCNGSVMKPIVIGGSGVGCDGGAATAAKRECPGTGVFLPRRYCNNPPESRKGQACSSPANLPARMIQYSNNTLAPITGQPQAHARINVGLVPHYEMLMGRRNAMIQAAQQLRSNIHGGVMESPVNNNPEMLLPQEWTY